MLAAGSAAWACTTTANETTNVSPSSGTPGTSVSSSTSGSGGATLPAGTYYFYYKDALVTSECHHATAVGAGVVLSSAGQVPSTNRNIPADATEGFNAQVCWGDTGHTNGSAPATFSVT